MPKTLTSAPDRRAVSPALAGPHGRPSPRFVALAIAAAAMALGLWTGLVRLGVPLPAGAYPPAELHSAFMICGFLGTVISLERAVAIGRWWAYGAPAAAAMGAIALALERGEVGAAAFVAAGAILVVTSAAVALRQFAMFVLVLIVGAASWTVGSALWLFGQSLPAVAGWWLNFLILTIAAERLELSRLLRVSPAGQALFSAFALLLIAGAVRAELASSWAPLTGVGLIGLSGWLMHHDVARRTVRLAGLPRFSALAILAGHLWLGVAGVLILGHSMSEQAMLLYDAAVHAIAIGFVLSMIFGHAPIVLPAVTGLRVRFAAAGYVPLALLHLSVLARVFADALAWLDLRAASGILTVVALAGYAITLIAASLRPAHA